MEQHRCSLNFRFLRRCEILAVTRNVETLCCFIIYPQSICPGEIQTDDSGSFIHRAQERASRKARMVLEGLAMPLPAMLKAVPWSGLVR